MTHLLISREYPPCLYPSGGIGTYVDHIARLLAESGETVHVVAERWAGAPRQRQARMGGRLIVHRVPVWRPLSLPDGRSTSDEATQLEALARSAFPAQAFSWQAARLAEHLVATEGINVIEGQDYEAPLSYLLQRRALGLGPAARPPCFVHLHTTREVVCRANEWPTSTAHDRLVARHEDYVIRAADALLCPSAFLARYTEHAYGLPAGSVTRLPYPIGDVPWLDRSADTWSGGTIVYVGRFEVRKGVLEWIEAAINVARHRPGLRFELIGSDSTLGGPAGPSVRAALEARIPGDLRSAFTFRDAMPRARLWPRLAQARIAVVPSRFENFPNVCVEAMCSGLPVVASPNGGMAEMIDDGRTGWLADSYQPSDLAHALTRALDASAETRARMGRAAATAIRQLCDNQKTVDGQLAFRRALVARGADRSTRAAGLPDAAETEPGTSNPPAPAFRVPVALLLRHPVYTAERLAWTISRWWRQGTPG